MCRRGGFGLFAVEKGRTRGKKAGRAIFARLGRFQGAVG
jgi:hypothetical protein